MGAIAVAIALILVIIFIILALYFVVFRKRPGFQFTDPVSLQCTYDSSCRIFAGGVAERCTPVSSGVENFCTAYCSVDSDCWGGNLGSTAQCIGDEYGRRLCHLKDASTGTCGVGEVTIGIPTATQNTNYYISAGAKLPDTDQYCFPLGLNVSPGTPSNTRLCSGSGVEPWGTSDMYCSLSQQGTYNELCLFNEDCGPGYNCSSGCSSKTPGSTGCDPPSSKSYCGPASKTVGVVVQCDASNSCPNNGACTNGVCTSQT